MLKNWRKNRKATKWSEDWLKKAEVAEETENMAHCSVLQKKHTAKKKLKMHWLQAEHRQVKIKKTYKILLGVRCLEQIALSNQIWAKLYYQYLQTTSECLPVQL